MGVGEGEEEGAALINSLRCRPLAFSLSQNVKSNRHELIFAGPETNSVAISDQPS